MVYVPKKRVYKRKVSKRTRKSTKKGVSNAVKTYVNRTIHRAAEIKMCYSYGANITVNTALSGTLAVAGLSLTPAIGVGTSNNQRIGNRVNVRSACLDIIFNQKDYALITNTFQYPTYVRIWILKYKLANTTTIDTSTFFNVNGSAIGFQSNTLDMLLDVNPDVFTVYQDKTFLLNGTTQVVSGTQYGNGTTYTRKFRFNVGKHLKSLQYDDAGTVCTNNNLIMFVQPVRADGTSTVNFSMLEYHYKYVVKYDDM